MRWLAPALAAVALAAAAGCGGGSSPPARTAPSPAQRLQAYFDAMEPQHRRFVELAESVVHAVDGVDPGTPGPSWQRAARRLDTATQGLNELGVSISHVEPPPPLAEVHRRYAEAVLAFSQYVYGVQQSLASGAPAVLATAAAADTTSVEQARVDWEAALKHAAQAAGIAEPSWLVPAPAA